MMGAWTLTLPSLHLWRRRRGVADAGVDALSHVVANATSGLGSVLRQGWNVTNQAAELGAQVRD